MASVNIPNTKEIQAFFHCTLCIREVEDIVRRTGLAQNPATYQRLEVGYTRIGVQVWCRRHEINVINFNFEGRDVPRNTTQTRS